MPFIKKNKKKSNPSRPRRYTESRAERMKIYNSTEWRKMRLAYLYEHPLCEVCEARGLVVPAVDVHHPDGFTNYADAAALAAAFDPGNVVALCKGCHGWIHRHGRTHGIDIEKVAADIEREEEFLKSHGY